ncbi:MAG: SMP-30/gluconolactonase/LRE family protein [Burkholderiales bacterium]
MTAPRVGKPSLWRFDPKSGKTENWALDRDVGALALRRKGGAVLALDDGFYFFDFGSGRLDTIALVDADQPRTRLNDGRCDRRGRFFAGGMDDKEELKICGLWRLDPELRVAKVDQGIICSNGPCWSPDDRTFYFADTFQGEMWAYDYDIEAGTLANKRLFASFEKDSGVADGSTVDAEGCVWNAQLISGDLVRYAPDGSVERRIGMPVRNITSVMFGGEKLDEIYGQENQSRPFSRAPPLEAAWRRFWASEVRACGHFACEIGQGATPVAPNFPAQLGTTHLQGARPATSEPQVSRGATRCRARGDTSGG